jgi:hypothetical protein
MNAFDLARLGGEPEGLRCNAEKARRLVQVEPWLFAVRRWPEDRDLMMRPVRGDTFACPAIAVAGHKSIAIANASDHIIAGDQHQLGAGWSSKPGLTGLRPRLSNGNVAPLSDFPGRCRKGRARSRADLRAGKVFAAPRRMALGQTLRSSSLRVPLIRRREGLCPIG